MSRRFSPSQLDIIKSNTSAQLESMAMEALLGSQRDEEHLRHQLDGNLCPLCLTLADELDAIYDGDVLDYVGSTVPVSRGWHRKCALRVLSAYPRRP